MKIKEYIRPKSLEEAYELLNNKNTAQLMGGGAYLRRSSKEIELVIDLCDLNLEYIKETNDHIEIGAMTTLRELEKSKALKKYFGNIISDSVKDIVGVQFKNYVTIGGSVYPRYGFSDLITALLALECKIVLHKAGEVKLEDYLRNKKESKDILTKIKLIKGETATSFKCLRNSSGDYSILNVAASKNEDGYKIAVGATPQVASLVPRVKELLDKGLSIDEYLINQAAKIACDDITFGDNYLSSKEYRKDICEVLVRRALMEVVK